MMRCGKINLKMNLTIIPKNGIIRFRQPKGVLKMAQKRKKYAIRLDKDPVARRQIVVMKLAGCTQEQIATTLKRSKKTIRLEFERQEHKQLFKKFVALIGKKQLPNDAWEVIEQELAEQV